MKKDQLKIRVEGRVLQSNFEEFCKDLRKTISDINLKPGTDEEFGEAESAAKDLKALEGAMKKAKEEALEQARDIQALFEQIDDVSGEARAARLELERAVKSRKEEVRKEIISEALYSSGLMDVPGTYRPAIELAVKGKRTIETIRKAANAAAKELFREVSEKQSVIQDFEQEHGAGLTHDKKGLLAMGKDALEIELERRLERRDADRERARKEASDAVSHLASLPPSPDEEHPEEDEMEAFLRTVRASLGQIKDARAALKEEANIQSAKDFAGAVNQAYAKLVATSDTSIGE